MKCRRVRVESQVNYQQIEDRYKKYYSITQYGSCTGNVNKFWHLRLEKNLPFSFYENVLEIGSGSGEHFTYVNHGFKNYYITDLYLPKLLEGVKTKIAISQELNDVQNVMVQAENVEKLTFSQNSFQRVVSTCLLHHVQNPLAALQEMRRVTCNGGTVSIYLPADPGLIYRFAQAVFSTSTLKKYFNKKEISFLRAGEHRNHVQSLSGLIEGVFSADRIEKKSFPRLNLGWNSVLFYIFQITINKATVNHE